MFQASQRVMRVRNYFESCASEYEWDIILFLYFIFVLCTSQITLRIIQKTRLTQLKSFFLCAKETNRRGTKEIKNGNNGEKKYNIERVINYKSTFLFSFRLFSWDGAEI